MGQRLDELVQERLAFVEGADQHALVAAVGPHVVPVLKEALYAVGWNARQPQIAAIGTTHRHVGTVTTPGHIVSVSRSNAFMMSGRMGEAGLAPSFVVMVMATWSSAIAFFMCSGRKCGGVVKMTRSTPQARTRSTIRACG